MTLRNSYRERIEHQALRLEKRDRELNSLCTTAFVLLVLIIACMMALVVGLISFTYTL